MEPEGLLPHSQEPATCLYRDVKYITIFSEHNVFVRPT
jgi:hypothetical protein